jgi:F420-non-reducing hydrogenase iron-sulfur subunit
MEKFEPMIVAFCCHYCAYTAADLAGTMRLQYPPNIRIVRLPCTGKVDVRFLLEAFEKGADGVYVAGCMEGDCHFLTGNFRAKKRVAYAKRLLEEIGIGGERLEMFNISAAMGPRFAEVAREMTEKIRKLGPSPNKKYAESMEPGAGRKEQNAENKGPSAERKEKDAAVQKP